MRALLAIVLPLLLAGCANLIDPMSGPAGVHYDDAQTTLRFEKDGLVVTGAEAFRLDVDPTPATREAHGVEPGRWIGVNVTVENRGHEPRRLAGVDQISVVDPFAVRIVDREGNWAKVFTSRRWIGGEMNMTDVYGPGESGVISLYFFRSERLEEGPIAFFIEGTGVRIQRVVETDRVFRP